MVGGLGLGIFNGFSAIDIDHCFDEETGELSDMAKEIIDYCNSYTEISPSGKGIRIIFRCKEINYDKNKYYTNNHKLGLEVYVEGATNKFVTLTGNCISSHDNISAIDIEDLLDKYMRKDGGLKPVTPIVEALPIEQFLQRDEVLNKLWFGKSDERSDSENDLALCSKLAFYLQKDPTAMRECFECSPYFASKDTAHKNKWLTRNDYRENTIQFAIKNCKKVYEPSIYASEIGNYGYNDSGNAMRFVEEYGDIVKYNIDNKMWMIWNGSYWQIDMYGVVRTYAEQLAESLKKNAIKMSTGKLQDLALKNVKRLLNRSGKDGMLLEAQHLSGIPVSNEVFDKNDYLFNTQSGVIDLRTGKLLQPSKMMLLSKIAAASYTEGNNKPERFLQFLNEIFNGDVEIINFLHKWFGYCLTGDCKEQLMVTLSGDGANGKSVLLQIINEIMGDYSAVSKAELLVDRKFQSNNSSELARLKGIRFCVVNELKLGDKLNESGVKDMTSGNTKIVARFLYGNEFEFYLKAKITLATNHDPRVVGTDNGIWRRLIKVPFNRVFAPEEQDKTLIDKLRAEKDAILGWLVDGCLKWQSEGLEVPRVLQDVKDEYRIEMDVIQQWLNECCVRGNYKTRSTALYESFRNYCRANNEYEMSQTIFGRNFVKRFRKCIENGVTVYMGVKLKDYESI